jgi:hypothetical protein
MASNSHNPLQCTQFEALLAEAIDGTLAAPEMVQFEAHARACADCGPMFAEARQGMQLLRTLAEVEPSRNLVRNILIATTGAEERKTVTAAPTTGWGERLRGWLEPVFAPVAATVRQPRFAMSFSMAFFSVALLLQVTGVSVGDLRNADLRPSSLRDAVVRKYYATSADVVRYYDNLRLVYEVQTRLEELRNAATAPQGQEQQPPAPANQQQQQQQKKEDDNTTRKPETNQNRQEQYSREMRGLTVASHGEVCLEDECPRTRKREAASDVRRMA